mgnify:CR=1 FL=1
MGSPRPPSQNTRRPIVEATSVAGPGDLVLANNFSVAIAMTPPGDAQSQRGEVVGKFGVASSDDKIRSRYATPEVSQNTEVGVIVKRRIEVDPACFEVIRTTTGYPSLLSASRK